MKLIEYNFCILNILLLGFTEINTINSNPYLMGKITPGI